MKAQRSTVWLAILAGALIASADSSLAQQKTVKECDAEWQANKAAIQASGKTKKDYVAACRQGTGHATAQPSGRAAASADGTKSQPASKASPRDTRTATQSPTRPQASPTPEAKSPSAKASPRATGNAAAA